MPGDGSTRAGRLCLSRGVAPELARWRGDAGARSLRSPGISRPTPLV